MSKTMSRGEIQDLLAQRAAEDPSFREALVEDPKGVLEEQLKTKLPESFNVKVVEETADTSYVIVPYVAGEGELEDAALDSVGGGFLHNWVHSYHSER